MNEGSARVSPQYLARVRAVRSGMESAKLNRRRAPANLAHDTDTAPVRPGTRLLILIAGILITLTGCREVVVERPASSSGARVEKASYADVVSNVVPTVVSIYTRSSLEGKTPEELKDDPRLQRYLEEHAGKEMARIPHALEGLGSGVVMSSGGYILTSAHVVDGADEITVTTSSGDDLKARVVGIDRPTDMAVLKVNPKTRLQTAALADSNNLRVGDVILAVGDSFGVGQTVTSGIVSATERTGFGVMQYEDFIQHDAPINPGNSGGALVDSRGRVVGINSAILTSGGGSEGIGFAVPINLARDVFQQIVAHGRVVRGFLGASLRPVTSDLAKAFNLPHGHGAWVEEVAPNSPAQQAGVRKGDIITQVNSKAVGNSRELRLQIAQTPPGTRMDLKVARIGGDKTVSVTLGQLAENDQEAQGGTGD